MAQGRVKDLESLFHRSEAELAAALSDKRGLESDVAELRAQLAKAGVGRPQSGREAGAGRGRCGSRRQADVLSGGSSLWLGCQRPAGFQALKPSTPHWSMCI